MSESDDALIVLGGGLTAQDELTDVARIRMDVAISAWHLGVAPHIVTTGGHSFLVNAHEVSEAIVMREYAIRQGVTEESIFTEESSLESIGNILFAKTEVVVPHGWRRLAVVTSVSHLPRSMRIADHVFGEGFEVRGLSAPERVGPRERMHELIGLLLLREVMRGTALGDGEAIREQLFSLIPGYGRGGTKGRLMMKCLLGLLRSTRAPS